MPLGTSAAGHAWGATLRRANAGPVGPRTRSSSSRPPRCACSCPRDTLGPPLVRTRTVPAGHRAASVCGSSKCRAGLEGAGQVLIFEPLGTTFICLWPQTAASGWGRLGHRAPGGARPGPAPWRVRVEEQSEAHAQGASSGASGASRGSRLRAPESAAGLLRPARGDPDCGGMGDGRRARSLWAGRLGGGRSRQTPEAVLPHRGMCSRQSAPPAPPPSNKTTARRRPLPPTVSKSPRPPQACEWATCPPRSCTVQRAARTH